MWSLAQEKRSVKCINSFLIPSTEYNYLNRWPQQETSSSIHNQTVSPFDHSNDQSSPAFRAINGAFSWSIHTLWNVTPFHRPTSRSSITLPSSFRSPNWNSLSPARRRGRKKKWRRLELCLRAPNNLHGVLSVMISDVIYPRAKFVPVGRHSSSAARLPLSRCRTAMDPRGCSGPEVEDSLETPFSAARWHAENWWSSRVPRLFSFQREVVEERRDFLFTELFNIRRVIFHPCLVQRSD